MALFALIAWLDPVLDHDVSLFALYLVPVLLSGWFLGARWGIRKLPGERGCLGYRRLGRSDLYRHSLIPYRNVAERLILLTVIVEMLPKTGFPALC